MDVKRELVDKLQDFIDAFETEYGEVEGFEVSLEHPIVDGDRQGYADIKEFVIKRIVRQEIEMFKLEDELEKQNKNVL